MRVARWTWVLPIGLLSLVGCGSAPTLLGSTDAVNEAVSVQARAPRPSIQIVRPTLSTRRLPAEGGPVIVGATVTLRNLTPEQITVVASALDSRRRVVATQPMAPAENGVWRTPEPGLVLPANFGNRATSFTVNVIVTTTGTPALKKGVRAGTVSVARGNADPNQPPPPPTF